MLHRLRNFGRLSVYKEKIKPRQFLTVYNKTRLANGIFFTSEVSFIFLGKVGRSENKHYGTSIISSIPCCIYKIIFNGIPVGLWNFVETSSGGGCRASTE